MEAVSGDFERRLAEQESPAVIVPHIESETRRGRGYVRITVSVEVSAPDVAQALTAAVSPLAATPRAGTCPAPQPRSGPKNH